MNESKLDESSTMHVRRVSGGSWGSKGSNDESVCDIKAVGGSNSEVSLGSAVNMSMASLNESMADVKRVSTSIIDESVTMVNVDDSVVLVKV